MKMTFSGGEIMGVVSPPPSKSHTHRAFFLAAMADGKSYVSNPLISEDTKATLDACAAIGAHISESNGIYEIDGGNLHPPSDIIDCMNSGTTMRIFTGLSSMFDGKTRITGDLSLRKRPMGPLLDALKQTGTVCSSDGGRAPLEITGPNRGGSVHIDGNISSQFITSLLMVSPMLNSDSEITVNKTLISGPYLDVTTSMMKSFGAIVENNGNRFKIKGRTGYHPHDYRVPSDFSSAAFPLVAGALGGSATVNGIDMNDPQGDKKIIDILRDAGAGITVDGDRITATKKDLLAHDMDLGSAPDLFPIAAVLMSTARGTSKIYGAPQLRFKESDRIETTVNMLKGLGADIKGTDDGCIIRGKETLTGGNVITCGDHRIMMAAAVASIICQGPVTVDDSECCAVSYPSFLEHMESLGIRIM